MDRINQFFSAASTRWKSLALWQKISIAGAFSMLFATVVVLILWASKADYTPLFSNLSMDDQAAITARLKEMKIEYKIDPAANAILVPSTQVYDTRIQLAGEGLPKGGVVGFELFDKTSFGMTDFQEQVAYIRALQGELARTIEEMEMVDAAKVTIVIPQEKLFLEEQQPPTASVLVKLAPMAVMESEQIKAIVNLVARSVEGLDAGNITVVDTTGQMLSDLIGDDFFIHGSGRKISTVQREMEKDQEQDMEKRVRSMLERIYGPGKAVVKVRMELDFDKKTKTLEEYIPGEGGKGVIRSEQNMEETFTGEGNPPGNVPGTETNIPGYQIPVQANGLVDYAKNENIRNYEITKQEDKFEATPGSLKRLSVSVIVDSDIPEPDKQNIQNIVAAAVGFKADRGDQIVVQGLKFSTALTDAWEAELAAQRMQRLVLVGVLLLAALTGGALALYIWRKRKLAASLLPQEEELPTLEELLAHPELLGEKGELPLLEEQLRAYTAKHPDEIAKLVKNWITEE